jgi:carbon-monoxide dehydrogenase medium subunit
MKPAPFEYIAPTTLDEALDVMSRHGADAKLLAGGQSLIPVLNFRLAQPAMIVDLNRIAALAPPPAANGDGLRIGAMVRQSQLERSRVIADHAPLLFETMPYVAHAQIRNRGTIGGSLAHADPAAELPVIMVALQARFKARRAGGERWIDAEAFFPSLFATSLEPDEMLVEIAVPALPRRTGYAFMEFARRHGDYAQAGVAAIIRLDDSGYCRQARLVYLNVGEVPMVARRAAAALVGHAPTADLIDGVARQAAQDEIDPTGDIHATADYKRHLAHVLGRRAITTAVARAREG